MKPITFENLRRLVGAGRKKKERQESSFKRSDSFKRISIRKNYLENRGGKGRGSKPPEKPPIEEEIDIPESLVIGYGQWIKCMRAEDYEHLKELNTSKSARDVPPTPPPRKKYSSPSSIDSSLEILKLDTSPVPVRRRMRKSTPPSYEAKDDRSDSGLSVSLGRVWMDAPLAMANAPRSLELPRPSPSVETDPSGRRIHHSLESALKERRDDKLGSRRFHNYPSRPLSPTPFIMPNPSAICRTLSSNTQTTSTSKTTSSRSSHELLSSSKDSGFSFSISIPRLSDLSPTSSGGGFFCKKKPVKLSVSGDGYFKRTTNYEDRDSFKSSGRKKKNSRKKSAGSSSSSAGKSDLYQVVINRPPRSLQSLKLDPMIFVPPERRKPTTRRPPRLEVHEIRDYCSPRDVKVPSDEDEGLYECISGDLDGRSGDDSDDAALSATVRFDDGGSEDEYAPVYGSEYSPEPERRPVRRKKSVKKGVVRYLAKPSIHRAPSTLKKNKKLLKKGRWPHVVSRY
ncbi:hypothetical protein GE061_003876 [Apolygus lucorum]|uniref:Uncharacterized protein n=1 Tax=Apolygus lucorum TaxID=248454 RepID=A0A6A4IY03_APOLU|nr:hypothetical protein GE061_003876 [Apolygus lucorum]